MEPTAGSTASPGRICMGGGEDAGPNLKSLPERFVCTDDVLAKEIVDLSYPWDLASIEERIQEYTRFSEKINAQLSSRVMQNYNEFVQGMQQVQAVETELTLIGVLIKNGRRKLQERDLGLVRGSMHVTRQHEKAKRLSFLLDTLSEFQGVVHMHSRLGECLSSENYCDAISQHQALEKALSNDKFKQFPGLLSLREGLEVYFANVQQKLSDGLRVAAVSAEFDAERYEEILKAYSMMAPEQALSVGKELLRHVTDCIVAVSRQCMLMFTTEPQEDIGDWRKAQLRELCRGMDPTQFVDCIARLYEHLCDFLYRHQFLCRWHEFRAKEAENEDSDSAVNCGIRFREVLLDVLTELNASKRNVWHHISQQVSLVLMTLEFQYPALSEDSFLHILHLTQMLIDEGDSFMADYQSGIGHAAASNPQWRQFSAPIKNTLKSKAHDYFQSLHCNVWVGFKVGYIDEDSWQRLPVARNYSLLRKEKLQVQFPRKDGIAVPTQPSGQNLDGGPRVRTSDSNPFRGYKVESLCQPNASSTEDGIGAMCHVGEVGDDIDEHALLQHWIDETDSLPQQQIGSSMLSNSNRSPVVSSSTVELAHILERYFRIMAALPQLALDVFQSAVQLVKFYVHCILCLFVQDRHLQAFLQDLESGQSSGSSPHAGSTSDSKLAARHEALLLQMLCPELRRAVMRLRETVSSLTLPPGCVSMLGAPDAQSGNALLQVRPFPKLASPGSLCGLSERCVGAESAGALLDSLRELAIWLGDRLPKQDREAVDRFLEEQEAISQQLRTFVLRCAACDVLEVQQIGRVSLDHFSNTMQALKWESKDFSQGSPGAVYLEQLRGQLDELARRIPCAGGGSIRYMTQRTVWGWVEARIMQECVEVIAKCGRKKSQEALQCLSDDFRSLRNAVNQHFQAAEGDEKHSEKDWQLLPPDHRLFVTTQWTYLDQYVEAHDGFPADIAVWCKRHPEYPLRTHKAIIDYLQGSNPKVQRQLHLEVEVAYTSFIAETFHELFVDRRGL